MSRTPPDPYIRYTFPTRPKPILAQKDQGLSLEASTGVHSPVEPTLRKDLANHAAFPGPTSTDLGQDGTTDPTSDRVLQWITNNTGEEPEDARAWQAAGQANAKARRRNHKAGGQGPKQDLNQVGKKPVVISSSADDDEELNPHLPERFGPGKVAQSKDLASAGPPVDRPPRKDTAIQKYFQDANNTSEAGSWRAYDEIPPSLEIMQQPAEDMVPRNQIEGAWSSTEEYLEAHYKLIREDAVFPLRAAVHQIREHPTALEEWFNGSIGIYDRVQIVGVTCDIRSIAIRVSFSLGRIGKRVKWEQSKRLISGTLVALTPASDMFQKTCIIAVVAARALHNVQLNPPEIDLYIPRAEEMQVDPAIQWVMVEERASYFEASRHVLTALQKLSLEEFPMKEHLVNLQTKVEMPSYIKQSPVLDMSTAFGMSEDYSIESVDVISAWPKSPDTTLDSTQLKALRRILAKKLAIVQGPPGTGKTHVSVVALRVMLANMQPGDPPLIVSCQTNHALDQLLRLVAVFETKFVRLGSRSKDNGVVKARTLYEVRTQTKIPSGVSRTKTSAITKMKAATVTIGDLLKPLATGSRDVLDPQLFKRFGLLSDRQCQSLINGDENWTNCNTEGILADQPMQQWLGSHLQVVTREVHPDDLAYDYEQVELESEQVQELEAEATMLDDEFMDDLRGRFYPIRDNFAGKTLAGLTEKDIEDILRNTQDLYRIPQKRRGSVFAYLQRKLKEKIITDVRAETRAYNAVATQRRIGSWEVDLAILRGQKLIGVTTTGLSKYRPLLSALNPRTILIEEAAESIEGPIAVACVPSLKHLILVGDHQQLRPQCSVKHFEGEPFNLNVSLFERLVINEVEFEIIRRQRRMIPEVRRLLEPIYGKGTIKDHETVKSADHRPPIPGMGGVNSFFFTHTWPESRDENFSACNVQEADMLVAFFDYLILNGTPAKSITVLTFYNGQRKAIIKAFRKHPNLKGYVYNVVTVDSYQGEQNEIILLSLTRSNDSHSIGFLSVVNRICVALSRAKRGFYIFGNAELLCPESKTWAEVVRIMLGHAGEICPEPRKRVGYYLPLQCQVHGRAILVDNVDDFEQINGGCTLACGGTLPCGHVCDLHCHPFEHDQVVCARPCQLVADCGHPCAATCCENCRCDSCDDEETPQQVPQMEASLRQLDGSGPAIPLAYAFPPLAPPQQRRQQPPSSSPSAWKDYAVDGVVAHDRQLIADPQRTFQEWDVSKVRDTTKDSKRRNIAQQEHPQRRQHPIEGGRESQPTEAPQSGGAAESLRKPASMNLIDLD